MRLLQMRLLFSMLLIALLAAAPADAQRTPQPPGAEDESEASARFRLADSYIEAHQFDRAIALLEDLHDANPQSLAVLDRLKDAYIGADRLDDAIALLRARIAATGATAPLLAELGGLYVGKGDLDTASGLWQEAIQAAPDNQHTYRALYSTLVQNRLWEDARDILLAGRERLRDPDLFRMELAELYSRSNQHGEALTEWAGLLAESPNRLSFVQGRIGRMLDQEQAADAFRTALDRLIRRDPMNLAYRHLAAWLAAETGDFSAGLDHVRAVDRLAQESGASILAYAEAALQASAYDVADRAFELILDQHADSSPAAAALLMSAELHERLAEQANERVASSSEVEARAPHYYQAVQRYEKFLEQYPAGPGAPLAMQRLAELNRDVFHNYNRARQLLEQIIAQFSENDPAINARFALGELALLEDDLTSARVAFTRLENELRIGERAERARFRLAQVDFYEGNFEMALSRVNAMTRNTATDVANNAIDLKLILSENQGPDSLSTPLRTFARAELRMRQNRAEEALTELEEIISAYSGHPIIALATFRRAEALRHVERTLESLDLLSTIPERFADSYLVDRALFLAAEIRERDLQDPAGALETYTYLISRYPGSLLAPEARTRIRRLRGDLPRS